jgi:hypothetical protein
VGQVRVRPIDSAGADLARSETAIEEGEVVWGGDIAKSRGPFLTASVARLWPLLPGAELEGLPAVLTTPSALPFVREWLRAFGARIFELPAQGAVRFTRMRVPEPAWRFDAWIASVMSSGSAARVWASTASPTTKPCSNGS